MTKTERIKLLFDRGFSAPEIAEATGYHPSLVRSVKARQKHGGSRPCDKAAQKKYMDRYRADPSVRAQRAEWQRKYRAKLRAAS